MHPHRRDRPRYRSDRLGGRYGRSRRRVMTLAGRVALVTGAANGIGRGIAEDFLRLGALVAAVDLDEKGLAQFRQVFSPPERLVSVTADVSHEADVRRAVATASEARGPVDILVNCAG